MCYGFVCVLSRVRILSSDCMCVCAVLAVGQVFGSLLLSAVSVCVLYYIGVCVCVYFRSRSEYEEKKTECISVDELNDFACWLN